MAPPARLIWTAPASDDLDDIAGWIALDDEVAAARLVERVLDAVERLRRLPGSGRRVPEIAPSPYREIIVPPCRIIYRRESADVLIVHVTREERLLRPGRLRRTRRSRRTGPRPA